MSGPGEWGASWCSMGTTMTPSGSERKSRHRAFPGVLEDSPPPAKNVHAFGVKDTDEPKTPHRWHGGQWIGVGRHR
jgi:hypothetical protein